MGNFGDSAELERRHYGKKTLDLLDELAKITGHGEILLGQVNDVLTSAVIAIKAKDIIIESLAIATGAPEGATVADMLAQLRAIKVRAETVRLTSEDDFSAFLAELVEFTTENKIPRDLASRIRKAGEELGELAEASITHSAIWLDPIREEAADLVNVGLDILLISGGRFNVVNDLLSNLRRKADKYRNGENRTEARP